MKGHAKLVFPRTWTHGLAQLVGDFVRLDKGKEYQPYECKNLFFDFSAVRSPKDVADFVSQYGLLYHTQGSEKVTDFLQEAASIRLLANLVILTRKKDTSALWDIWRVTEFSNLFEAPPQNDDELLAQTSVLVAWTINEQLEGVRHGLIAESALEVDGIPGQPGVFLWVAYPDNLLQYIYHHFAMTINHRAPLATCPECGKVFVPEHGHQQYCSPRCSNRARIKRFRQKSPQR